MSQIQDKIWIGSYEDAMNQKFLNERKIEHILCCAEEFKDISYNLLISNKSNQWYRVPIVDNVVDHTTADKFKEGAMKINEWVEAGHRVIVHCFLGMSRSVSTVIAYLMIYKGWSFNIAFNHVSFRRPQTNIYPEFLPILKGLNAPHY